MAIMVKDGIIQTSKTSLQYGLELIDPSISRHVVEFGVWKGDTLRLIRDTLDASWSVFGFDSFRGEPEDWHGTHIKKGDWDMGGVGIGVFGTVEYIGMFADTIPRFIADHPEPVALIHMDCNLYTSTMDVLEGMDKLIVPGTVIVYDDWQFIDAYDQQTAHKDWKALYGREADLIPFDDLTVRVQYGEQRQIAVVTK